MQLSEAIYTFLTGYKQQTRKTYKRYLNQLEGFIGGGMPLEKITVLDIARYSELMREHRLKSGRGYALKTLHTAFKSVKTFFNWCVENNLLPESPARTMEVPAIEDVNTRDKAMSDEDLRTLLAYTQNMPREYALIRFASETAARRGGVVSLRLGHLDLNNPRYVDGQEVYVARIRNKGGKLVEVGFYVTAAQALRRWLLIRPHCEHDYVFTTNRLKPMSDDYADQILRRLASKIKRDWGYEMTNWNFHSMRHRMGHKMGDKNVPISLIAAKLTHRDIMTTARYYLQNDKESAWSSAAGMTLDPQVPEVSSDRNIIQFPARKLESR